MHEQIFLEKITQPFVLLKTANKTKEKKKEILGPPYAVQSTNQEKKKKEETAQIFPITYTLFLFLKEGDLSPALFLASIRFLKGFFLVKKRTIGAHKNGF